MEDEHTLVPVFMARLRRHMFVIILLLHVLTSTTCEGLQICPDSSTNCQNRGYDHQYVYGVTCSNLAVQEELPGACQYSLIVRELTIDPGTSVINTLPARALDGLRVRKLVLSGLGIQSVNESAFVWLAAELEELSLDGNLLTDLPRGVFSSLSSLVHLQLQNNQLTTISTYLLDGLLNLLVLDLSGNRISEMHAGAWETVPLLRTLRLQNNIINGPMNSTRLAGLAELRQLQLDGNQISGITTDAFRRLPYLRSLNIARNRIPALLDNTFADNTELEELDASNNEIVGLTLNVFNETKRLTTLSLHDNQIDTLPIYVFRHMYNLRTLLLRGNSISGFLSNSLSGLSSLRHLDLSGNRIGSLPTGVFDPLGLVETLSLAGNRVMVVERRPFQSMRNLATLDLSGNQLTSVDDDWFQTTIRLTELHLDNNRLNTIHPQAFSKMSKLQELYINRNLLSSVNGGLFGNCSSLSHLDLSSNPLRVLQDGETTFAGLTALQQMNLTWTCLTEFSFSSNTTGPVLPSLEVLDLSSNALNNLTFFAFVPSVRRLHLAANDIEQLHNSTFSALTNLELLDLSRNALSSEDQLSTALSTLPQSVVLDLSWNVLTRVDELPVLSGGIYMAGNPLRCDCNSSSPLKIDSTLLLDGQQIACLNVETGQPELLTCHWSTCSSNSRVSTQALQSQAGCVAPQGALSYLAVPRRRPAVICPWDLVPATVQSVSVDIVSTTTVSIQWNLTAATDVVVTVRSNSNTANDSSEIYAKPVPANVTECTVSNLTYGETYTVCVTTVSGHRTCVVVVVSMKGTTVQSLPSLDLRMSATSTQSALHVTWDVQMTATSGIVDVTHFRLTWMENGSSSDVSTAWMDSSNTSYTISDLRPSTVYLVCVQALGEVGRTVTNETQCEYFSTQSAVVNADTDDMMLIIIIAAAAGAFLLIVIVIIVIVCCCCRPCCRRSNDKPKTDVTVRHAESTRSFTRGSLPQHSTVSVSVYDDLPY